MSSLIIGIFEEVFAGLVSDILSGSISQQSANILITCVIVTMTVLVWRDSTTFRRQTTHLAHLFTRLTGIGDQLHHIPDTEDP